MERIPDGSAARVARLDEEANGKPRVHRLLELAARGLPAMTGRSAGAYVQTVRGIAGTDGPHLRPEGDNLRYAAIVALGAAWLDEPAQHTVLGMSAADLASVTARRAADAADLGAVALAAWASAEVAGKFEPDLFDRLRRQLVSDEPIATVVCSWGITAATAARELGEVDEIRSSSIERLLDEQGPQGIFPHHLPRAASGRFRSHIGCFADQVYPIQALSREFAATGDPRLRDAALACASQIVRLQGSAGQWWWHYDARNGEVVEGFPVYSVHQHAMAPMALFELDEAAGTDHGPSIALGLDWLYTHPEVFEELIDDRNSVVWRKVGRREPTKAARKLAAVLTSVRPGAHVPAVDRVLPPVVIDHECRPYELGWLLYAWLSAGVANGGGSHD